MDAVVPRGPHVESMDGNPTSTFDVLGRDPKKLPYFFPPWQVWLGKRKPTILLTRCWTLASTTVRVPHYDGITSQVVPHDYVPRQARVSQSLRLHFLTTGDRHCEGRSLDLPRDVILKYIATSKRVQAGFLGFGHRLAELSLL